MIVDKKVFALAALTLLLALGYGFFPATAAASGPESVAMIINHNNRGVALLDQYKFKEAAEQFTAILEIDQDVMPAHLNLGIAYFYDQKYDEATASFQETLRLDPDEIHAHYLLGLIYRNQDEVEKAIASFEAVSKQDPYDSSTNYYLGRLYMRNRDYETATTFFKKVIEREPYNASAHYNLATALNRSGKREEGMAEMKEFRRLQNLFGSTTVGLQYLEQGRYAIAIDNIPSKYLPGPAPTDPTKVDVTFAEVSADAGLTAKHAGPGSAPNAVGSREQFEKTLIPFVGSGIAFGDYDKDGWVDLFVPNAGSSARPALYKNRGGGKFEDVTEASRIGYSGNTMHAFWGDYDNDGYTDLYLANYGANTLYRNMQDGTFTDVTTTTGTGDEAWSIGGSFVDFDHDGDLDIVVANIAGTPDFSTGPQTFPTQFPGAENTVYQNNGNGAFTNVSKETRLAGDGNQTVTLLTYDFDNSRDVDVLELNLKGPSQVMNNLRDGSFQEARNTGLGVLADGVGAAVGDYNNDGLLDLALSGSAGQANALFENLGNNRFAPAKSGMPKLPPRVSRQAFQFFDYDNDGDLDLLAVMSNLFSEGGAKTGQNLLLFENDNGSFADVSSKAGLSRIVGKPIRGTSVADFDNDGDLDFAVSVNGEAPLLFRNDGGNQNNWLNVSLVGTNSNKSALGVKAEIKAGRLYQKTETSGGHGFMSYNPPTLHFGLGKQKQADVVRLVWPNGVLQSEIDQPANKTVEIQELDRKGTSCPILYVWDGSTYRFQTDFLGGSAYGNLVAPGKYNYPDTDEYIKLRRDDLSLKEGALQITMNNQLEEAILFDQVQVVAVDHPSDYEVFADEKLLPGPPYQEFRLFSASDPRLPVSAYSETGDDVLTSISKIDRVYSHVPNPLPFKGYTDQHSLTLDLGPVSNDYAVLLMHAWIDYADSSSNLAASQSGVTLVPPYLQVKDRSGEWQTVIERMGFPAGLPKTMTVDLSGKFLSDSREVRILTNMRIFWDQILVASGQPREDFQVHRLSTSRADLRYKGFPKFESPDGKLPKVYDYDAPSYPEWKVHVGAYTKFGEVTPLLNEKDDMFVITRSGDEIEASFDVSSLPQLPVGWTRDYFVYVDGFGKDMDPNSAGPEFLGPLPFHGMSTYPYAEGESFPDAPRFIEYFRKWNTRIYGEALPELPIRQAEE